MNKALISRFHVFFLYSWETGADAFLVICCMLILSKYQFIQKYLYVETFLRLRIKSLYHLLDKRQSHSISYLCLLTKLLAEDKTCAEHTLNQVRKILCRTRFCWQCVRDPVHTTTFLKYQCALLLIQNFSQWTPHRH